MQGEGGERVAAVGKKQARFAGRSFCRVPQQGRYAEPTGVDVRHKDNKASVAAGGRYSAGDLRATVCVQRSRFIGKAHTGNRKPGLLYDPLKLSTECMLHPYNQ